MAHYFISGVWRDNAGVITDYAFHLFNNENNTFGPLQRKSKIDAILLLSLGNTAQTLLWNYTDATWKKGANVNLVGTAPDQYLRTSGDSTVRDNLDNLISFRGFF